MLCLFNRVENAATAEENNASIHVSFDTLAAAICLITSIFLLSALVVICIHPIAFKTTHVSKNYSAFQMGSGEYICLDTASETDANYISLLRVMQLQIKVSILVRLAAMCPLFCVFFALLTRRRRFLKCSNEATLLGRLIVNIIVVAFPLHIASLVLVAMTNARIDAKFNFQAINYFFAFTSIFSMVIYVMLDLYDRSTNVVRCLRFKCRLLCMLINIYFHKTVLQNYSAFIELFLCHPYVSLQMALVEYTYVIAHLLFYATMLFDFDGLELMTTTADVLFIDSCLDDVYEPYDQFSKRSGEIMTKRVSAN